MKNLIVYLGTPRLFSEVLMYLKEKGMKQGVFLTRASSGEWVVQETVLAFPRNYFYRELESLHAEFPALMVNPLRENVCLVSDISLSSEDHALLSKLFQIHFSLLSMEEKETMISRLTYNMVGMETIMNSFLEPMEALDILTLFTDALGELVLSASALYQKQGDRFVQVHVHGTPLSAKSLLCTTQNSQEFHFSFPEDLNQKKLFPELLEGTPAPLLVGLPIHRENLVAFVIVLSRQEPMDAEEMGVVQTLSRLFGKALEFQVAKTRALSEERELEKSRYQLLTLFKGLEYLFSRDSIDSFSQALEEMIRETLGVEKVTVFLRKTWGNILWACSASDGLKSMLLKYSTTWDQYDLSDPVEKGAFLEDFGNAQSVLSQLAFPLVSPRIPFCAVIRSLEGNILGLVFLPDMLREDREFLKMICRTAGISMENMLVQRDFSRILHSYEALMDSFQKMNQLHKKIQDTSGIVEFYSAMRGALIEWFDIRDFFVAFRSHKEIISFPAPLSPHLRKSFEAILASQSNDLQIEPSEEEGFFLFFIPLRVKKRKILMAIEAKDEPRINVLLQLIQLGFQEKLAKILAEEN